MKIGMILDHVFPPDLRVENEAVSLVEAGHEVLILSLRHSETLPERETFRGIGIHRFLKNIQWVKKGRALINSLLDFYTTAWSEEIINFAHKNKIDVLHVHDLYMLGAAFKANRKLHLPIVSDLHENYVEGLKHYRFANTFPGNILVPQKKWARKEIEWTRQADRVITVIDEAVDRYAGMGVSRDKLTVVANYVHPQDFLKEDFDPSIIDRYKDRFVAAYIGAFDYHRGLESVVKAVPAIIREIPDFLLLLVGSGQNLDGLKALASESGISSHVDFQGFQPAQKLPSYIKASRIGLIPHLKTVHTDNTIPHKLFHYMLLEKPVVASNCTPIERIVTSSDAGLIYTSNNSQEIAERIVHLYKNPEQMKRLAQNGRQAVLEKYTWDLTAKNLNAMYAQLEIA
ncbi:MAG: glycosyltransferase WbuB [Calditrichales bacterium]|nr:MAG: glycosyltransferase WbuB [Calditrichales bacterium]